MQVIKKPYGKEIRSRNEREIRAIGHEYDKKGAKTDITRVFVDLNQQMWNLRVSEAEERFFKQMGQMYKP